MRALAAILVLVASAASTASAQDDLFERVGALRARGLDLAAARLLEARRESDPSPRVSAELGLAYLGADRAVDAEIHLSRATSVEDDAWIEEHREGLELALRHARRSLGWVLVSCDVPDAEVHVPSTTQPPVACGERVRIGIGDRSFEVRAWGHRSVREIVNVGPGETVEARVSLPSFECATPGTWHIGGEDGGCCWPDQAWLEGSCSGAPECPDGGWLRGNECFSADAPPPGLRRLASFRVSILGGAAAFGRTDTSLFRSPAGVPAQGPGISVGPRLELRVGIKLFDLFGLELTAGGTLQDTTRWLDCPSGACAVRSPTAYTLDAGVLFVAHSDPPRVGGNVDLHLGIGARPYVRTLFDGDGDGADLTATVVPAELGASIYVGDALSIDVLGQAELWIPWEYCGRGPDGAAYCLGSDALEIELAWTALAGITFHAE